MFDTLLELPLFQGLGQDDLIRIVESTRLEFLQPHAGDVLTRQDEICTGLLFLHQGSLTSHTMAADRSWWVEEELTGHRVLGLEVLYGHRREHLRSLKVSSPTANIFLMDKRTVGALVAYYEVFRLNVLNQLTTQAVRQQQLLWQPAGKNLAQRIVHFMQAHLTHPAGAKRFGITQRQLGQYLGEDYRYVGRALHQLADQGLLRLHRQVIEVPNFEALLHYELWNI